ncbi:MAG: anti-sigma factor domain-containing protein, partial [Lutispora sp.]|nr:anti-sigma factor domain-containing protein [Lutispora sp.]
MKKGVVIKINKNRATLMAEDCTFCEIKAFNGMYNGMEVCFSDVDILRRKVIYRTNKYVNAACFMLLVFCSYLFLSFYQENIAAYAYVGIDINPSIEMALNKKGKIINIRGLDEEGKELLEEIDLKKMDSVDGIKQIIAKTIDMDYLESGDSNKITVYAVMEKENSKGGSELIQKMGKAIKEEVEAHSIKGEIKTIVYDKEIKNKADKMGISVAKYISQDAKVVIAEDNKDKTLKEDKKDKKDKQDKNNKDKDDEDDNDDEEDDDDDDKDDKNKDKKNKNNKNKMDDNKGKDDKDIKNKEAKNINDSKGNNKIEQKNKENKQKNEKDKNKNNEKQK